MLFLKHMNKKIFTKKLNIALIVIALLAVLIEIFVFNISSFRTGGLQPLEIAADGITDENGDYYSEIYEVNGPVVNVYADVDAVDYDLAKVSVILTDEGDKYVYTTPEFIVCNGVMSTRYSNIYSCGQVSTVVVRVQAYEGTKVNINSITVNAHRPVDVKPLRLVILFAVMLLLYLSFTQSFIHEIYSDEKSLWQWIVSGIVITLLIVMGVRMAKSDLILQTANPWPHHRQYQELAHSLAEGTVVLTEKYVDPAILEVENPYDTIALGVEGIAYNMDYAFYNGNYYVYFGIIPEMLFYYPYYRLTGNDLGNVQVMYLLFAVFVAGAFVLAHGLAFKYAKSMPYFYRLLATAGLVLVANYIYLCARPDIYNIPIMGAVAFTMLGLGCFRCALNLGTGEKKIWTVIRLVLIFIGALSMAAVAGCRPQLLLLSGIAVIWFLFEDGWKERRLLTKKTITDTIVFALPYVGIAILVCWYNYARFGNILDFGATYSLTTNDMNHRGFNLERLFRGLYSFLLQPASYTTDFPFLVATNLNCSYMGRYMIEYTLGGMLVSNGFMFSILLLLISGHKKLEGGLKALIYYLIGAGLIIAAFDVNGAGVLYRYTCDCALPLSIAALIVWMIVLDKGHNIIRYDAATRLFAICIILGLAYSLCTFVATGNSINLADDNPVLYYSIASYFKF